MRLIKIALALQIVSTLCSLACAVLLATGCDLQPVAIRVIDEREAPDVVERDQYGQPILIPIVADACDLLEVECGATDVDYDRGVVQLRIVDDAGHGLGGTTENGSMDRRCRKAARAEPHVALVAHELGHLFGLEHVDDEANLMYRRELVDVEPELEQWQYDDLHAGAARLGRCL